MKPLNVGIVMEMYYPMQIINDEIIIIIVRGYVIIQKRI